MYVWVVDQGSESGYRDACNAKIIKLSDLLQFIYCISVYTIIIFRLKQILEI